jgi:hypothetical protein
MSMLFAGGLRSILWAALVCAALPGRAHQSSDSYLTLHVEGALITGQWDVALRDLEQVVSLDANDDGNVTPAEVQLCQDRIAGYAASRLQFKADDIPLWFQVTEQLIEEFTDGTYAVLRFEIESPLAARILEVDYRAFFDLDSHHRGLARLESGGRTQTGIFTPDRPTHQFDLETGSSARQFLAFGREGVWHIWLGFDHVLFLLALLLPSVLRRGSGGWERVDGFRPAFIKVLKIVTAFTVAHSVTLSLATLGLVQLPSRLVESTIAASIILAALNNIRPIFPERGWMVALAFGLIHGFGFANVLSDLGLSRQTLALALVGFNLGVEIGQLAIVSAFLPLAFALRGSWFYRRLTFQFGSAMIALLAATWMAERIWDFKFLPF